MTPRFLSGRGGIQRGVLCEKCLLRIWETSLWGGSGRWVGSEDLGSRETWQTDVALSIMNVGGWSLVLGSALSLKERE